MGRYTANIQVTVYPFTRQADDEEVVIGRPDTNVFLVLPLDALELLDLLASGMTVGEAQALYAEKYNEIPDMDFLEILEQKGLVYPREQAIVPQSTIPSTPFTSHPPAPIRFHFVNISSSLARRCVSRPVLVSCSGLIGSAMVAIALDPTLIPTWNAYVFQENVTLSVLILMMLDCVALLLHEMAHLVAARSVGVSCRLGFSHRLWMLVAETDMTGVWGIPRNQRYLPFLAGPLVDLVTASLLILIFFGQHQGWIELHPTVFQLGQALLLTYFLHLLWQCYLFVRTDFYYVIANFFRCKNLMKDTEIFLANQLAQFLPFISRVSQSHIPASEQRVIRGYAVLWVMGRAVSLYALISISFRVLWHYATSLATVLNTGYFANPHAFIDALLMVLLVFTPQVIGLWLWIRSFSLRNLLLSLR